MVDTEQLERLAASEEEMPDGLAMPEQLLFLTLRELYKNFRSGAVNRERGKREKSRILVAYRGLASEYAIVEQHLQIRKRLTKNIGDIYKCGCQNCKKLINIFNGIDRKDIPEDIKELHAWNERLRDLVKERSDRNAELATLIDRVRWALEKNDIERAKEIVNHV
jgi:predicted transcriptional regulator